MTINIINSNSKTTLTLCLEQMQEEDSILFMGDGVTLLTSNEIQNLVSPHQAYIMQTEFAAKSLKNIIPKNIKTISYQDLVTIIIYNKKSITWN